MQLFRSKISSLVKWKKNEICFLLTDEAIKPYLIQQYFRWSDTNFDIKIFLYDEATLLLKICAIQRHLCWTTRLKDQSHIYFVFFALISTFYWNKNKICFKVHEMAFLDHILDFIYHICNQRYNFWNFTIIFFSSYRELEQTRSLFFTWGIIGLRLA